MIGQGARAPKGVGLAMTAVSADSVESPVTVALVTTLSLLRVSVADALAAPDLAVYAVDPRSAGALADLARARPHVLVVDASGRRSALVAEVASTGAAVADARVLVLTDPDDHDGVLEAFAHGADACLPVSASLADLAHSVRALASGEWVVNQAQLLDLMEHGGRTGARDGHRADVMEGLTGREVEVLQLLVQGATTGQIAQKFGIAPVTVRSHVQSILGKLGVHSRLEAVAAFLAARDG